MSSWEEMKFMSISVFGEYFKILRLKHREVLADAKSFLGVSSSFISAVECGKKQIPADWYEKIVEHYRLNVSQSRELREVIERSQKAVKIDLERATTTQKDLALQFQRSFEDLDDETVEEIRKILERNK